MRGSCAARQCGLFLSCLVLFVWTGDVAVAADWTSLGLDLSRARATAERSGSSFRASAWSFASPLGTDMVAAPVVADGLVVTAGLDGSIAALGAEDGQPAWFRAANAGIYASPAVHRGLIFVSSLDGNVRAIRLADGGLVWERDLGGVQHSSPVVVDGSIIVTGGFPLRRVFRIDAASGGTVWEAGGETLSQFSNSPVAVADDPVGGQVIVAAMEGHLYSFDLATGAHRWTYQADGIVSLAAPLIADERVYLLPGGSSTRLHAVDLLTGRAAPGWPVEIAAPALDVGGKSVSHQRAVSSLALAGSRLVFDLRLDDFIDTGTDGQADTFVMRELVAAVDAESGRPLWSTPNGRRQTDSWNDIPKHWLCPTPVVYTGGAGASAGAPLVVTTSTILARARVLDAITGREQWSAPLDGTSRISPILANGRVFAATDGGVVHAFLSSSNQPPPAPMMNLPSGRPLDASAPWLRWLEARDPNGDDVSYELRVDDDGEVLEDWLFQVTVSGATSARLPGALRPGTQYTVALRSRDSWGALSRWSEREQVVAAAAPAASVGRESHPSLTAALAAARVGQVVELAAGTLYLGETLRIPAGVSVTGAGAHRTVIDGVGLGTALSIEGSATGATTEISGVTVTGARVGIAARDNRAARLRNVVVHHNSQAGIEVSASGRLTVVNATVVSNGAGLRVYGHADVKNSLVIGNDVGLTATHGGAIVTRFNDVYRNRDGDYQGQGVQRGETDMAAEVSFVNSGAEDYRLLPKQPSTDRGDPTDDFSAEPGPNGGRINLGAFGGTSDAELSLSAPTLDPVTAAPAGPVSPDRPDYAVAASGPTGGGCTVAAEQPPRLSLAAFAAMAFGAAVSSLVIRRPRAPRKRKACRGPAGRRALAVVVSLGSALSLANMARGATVIWAGGTGTYGTAANWIDGAVPGTGDTATFAGWAPVSRSAWTASASLNSGNAGRATDGTRSTLWDTATNQASGQTYTVNMGSATMVKRVTIDSTTRANDYPRAFTISTSTNGTSWTQVATGTGSSALVTVTFSSASWSQYIRIELTTSAANWWSIGELYVYSMTGDTELSRNGWTASGSASGGGAASGAIDGNTGTGWSPGVVQANGQWFQVDMGSAQTFSRIDLEAYNNENDYPRGYSVYVSSDGTNWGSSIASGSGTTPLTSITFSSQTKRYIRVYQTGSSASYWWFIIEFKVYGTPMTCTVSSNTTVGAVNIQKPITVTQASGVTLTVSGDVYQTDGTFTGGNSTISVGGDLNLSSGAFTSTSGRLMVGGAFNRTGGTFTHNSGTVLLTSTSNQTFATSGAAFNNLTINDGLVGYWRLDEGSGSSAADGSGYGNTGTVSSASWQSGGAPLSFDNSNHLSFNGSSSYVTLGTNSLPATNAAQTISLWAKLNSTGGSSQNLIALSNITNSGIQIKVGGGNVGAYNWGGGTLVAATAPSTGTWHHIVYTYDGSTGQKLYINGTVTTASASNQSGSVTDAYLGTYYPVNEPFSGFLDDVRIYKRALSASEVYALFIGNQPGTYVATQTMTGSPSVAGDLTLASGNLDIGTNTLTVGGNWWNYGGTFGSTSWNGAKVVFNGAGLTNVIRSSGHVFPDVEITGSGKWTLADNLDTEAGNILTITAGTLDLSTRTLRVGNIVGGSGALTTTNSTVVLSSSTDRTLSSGTYNVLRVESPVGTNLKAYWKLDEGTGGYTKDWSQNGYTGTLQYGPAWTTTKPSGIDFHNRHGLRFDGADDYVETWGPVVASNAAFTACAWVNFNGVSGHQTLVSIDGTNISGFFLKKANIGPTFALDLRASDDIGATLYSATGTTIVTTGTWYHVCGVYTGSVARIYVNGAQEGSDATVSSAFNAAGKTIVGAAKWNGARTDYLNGVLDDVRVYNVALTAAEIGRLAAGGYPNRGGAATHTLGTNVTVNSTFAVDSANVSTSSYTLTAANTDTSQTAYLYAGTYTVGSAASRFKGGLTVEATGTVTLATNGGSVRIDSGKVLALDGTLNASNTGAAIQNGGSGNYAFRVGTSASATPTLNISGLQVKHTDTNGMFINYNTGASTTFTQFDNIAFSSGTGTRLLQIYATSLYLKSNGCSFDAGQASTTTYNVTLTGNGTATETRAMFGNATCASDKASCEAYDNDDDSGNDGAGDNTGSNGAVVQWLSRITTDTSGTIEAFPVAAFDWNTFTYYSTYVVFHDVGGGTTDRVYVRSSAGAAAYYWEPSSGEHIVGAPRFDTVSSVRYVYVSTSNGKVYRLIDNTGSSTLTKDNSGSWAGANNPYDCSCTIVTPLSMDTNNLYWGGTASGNKVWTLVKSTRALVASSPVTVSVAVTPAAPATWTYSNNTYIFMGSTAHFYKVNATNQSLTTDNSSPTGTVNGRLTVFDNKVYAGDTGGTLWALSAVNFGTTSWSYHDNTNHNGCSSGSCAITGPVYVQFQAARVFYGDSDGHLYAAYNSSGTTGAQRTGYPFRPGTSSDVFATAPLYHNGVLVAGTTTGNVYLIDANNGTTGPALTATYKLGTTTNISGIGYNASTNSYMIAASDPTTKDGKVYYIAVVADPTSGSP